MVEYEDELEWTRDGKGDHCLRWTSSDGWRERNNGMKLV